MPQVRLPWTLLWPRTGDGPAPFAADIAAQQKQVHDFADGVDAVFLLGQSQTPGDDRAVGAQIDLGQFADRRLLDAGLVHDLRPGVSSHSAR